MASTLIQDAVMRNLQLIGQSCRSLPDETRATHPEINWRGVIGLRNILVHQYLGVNLVTVWEVIEGFLPDFKQGIELMLGEPRNSP